MDLFFCVLASHLPVGAASVIFFSISMRHALKVKIYLRIEIKFFFGQDPNAFGLLAKDRNIRSWLAASILLRSTVEKYDTKKEIKGKA